VCVGPSGEASPVLCPFGPRAGHGFALIFADYANFSQFITSARNGSGLLYDGLPNTLAIEFDIWKDASEFDISDNHVSIQSSFSRDGVSSHHSTSIGLTYDIEDFLDGNIHTFKLVYEAQFDDRILHPIFCQELNSCGKFYLETQFGSLLEAIQIFDGQLFGSLWLFIDDFIIPKIIVPFSATTFLNLYNQTSSYVGFTSTNDDNIWSSPQIFNFQMCTQLNSSTTNCWTF